METVQEFINTQYSYSLPSPSMMKQKQLFNSKAEESFLQKGHIGEVDFLDESFNITKNFDINKNPTQSIQNFPDKQDENILESIKSPIKGKKKKQSVQIYESQTPNQTFRMSQIIEQHNNTQNPMNKIMETSPKSSRFLNLQLAQSDDKRKKSRPGTETNLRFPRSSIFSDKKNKPCFLDLTNQVMTQEQMKIKNIFQKKFEVRRDLKVLKFLRILVSRWQNRRMNLNEYQLNLINDKSYFYQTTKENQYVCLLQSIQQIYFYFGKIFYYVPLLNPTDFSRLLWDFFMITAMGIFLFYYSALVFFAQQEQYISSVYAKLAFSCLLIDIILNFNTSFYSKESIIRERVHIAKQYLRSTFIFDILSFFILGLNMNKDNMVENHTNSVLIYIQNSIVFLKIASFQHKIKHLEQSVPMKEVWRHMLALIGLLASLVIVAHCVAIVWNQIALYEQSVGLDNWQTKLGINNESWDIRYIYSLYWSVTTMFTIGYGDITPLNKYEVGFVTIVIIFCSTVFAYSINSIGIILSDIAKVSKQYKEDLSIMNRFLSRKQVNIDLQFRVKKYLSFLAQEEKEVNKKAEDAVIDKLSQNLKDQINIEVNTKILRKYPLFAKNFSEKALQRLVFVMQEVVVTPNELIIQEGQFDDCSLYLITKGTVEVYSLGDPLYQNQLSNKKVLAQLSKGQYFGELSFFTGVSRTANVRSQSLTTMYKITQQQFIETLKMSNEQDFEKFCMIRDQINLKNFENIQLNCYSCNEQGHLIQECPRLTYDVDRIIRFFRINYSEYQDEQLFQRYRQKKKNTLKIFQNETLKNFQSTMKDLIDDYFIKISQIQIDSVQTKLQIKTILEFENEENDSLDDSQTTSKVKIHSFDDLKQSKENQSYKNLNIEEEKKIEQQQEEEVKKEKKVQQDVSSEKIIVATSSFSNSNSLTGSDNRMKQNQKDITRMKTKFLNNITNSKVVDSNTNIKTLQSIQQEQDGIDLEKNQNQVDMQIKLMSEFENRSRISKIEDDFNKVTNKQSSITSSSLAKREYKRDSTFDRKDSIIINLLGNETKRNSKLDHTTKQQNSLENSRNIDLKQDNLKEVIEQFKCYPFVIHDFDKMKIFKLYYPSFNYNIVLQDIQQQKRKLSKFKKFKCKKWNQIQILKKNTINLQGKASKRSILKQNIKNKILLNIHPIIYGAAGINKYPYYSK
ncbi:cyclic nucleotide-binding domain protein (macronuclear) [Tetrahymena thermophila SB210]|uniref:Cyclic nucleotide-binding domain protein n=1 Tax=Tetrahymena thermophila (strain SB210) TaxID=312017 RepID=I7MEJ7_TETTS|nr:cyclic nucleotide-binding domain protein [Tetrahymena thermophila SB210]EAR96485.2 cyclic nucleotide-binding domain protein [Tetrahymena thermophila SB210]|eukprot:XP_001016730.2 cyclic nucleotide-binding domain protein [Tetrahymena thermophila SB210]